MGYLMANLVESIKKAAIEAVNASDPATFYFGTVTSANPLSINVEQKMDLTSEFLILTNAVKDHDVEVTVDFSTEITSLDASHSHSANSNVDGTCDVQISNTVTPSTTKVVSKATAKLNLSVDVDVETQNIDLSHKHNVRGKKKITVHNALKKGEKVVMIKLQGGQKFIVLDRC